MPQRGVTAEYPAILKLYPCNSRYVATWLRGYVASGYAETLTVTLTLSGYVATWLRDYVANLNSNSNTKWLRGYAASFLLLFTISGKCCGRLKYFRPIAGTYFQAVER